MIFSSLMQSRNDREDKTLSTSMELEVLQLIHYLISLNYRADKYL